MLNLQPKTKFAAIVKISQLGGRQLIVHLRYGPFISLTMDCALEALSDCPFSGVCHLVFWVRHIRLVI